MSALSTFAQPLISHALTGLSVCHATTKHTKMSLRKRLMFCAVRVFSFLDKEAAFLSQCRGVCRFLLWSPTLT